MLRAAVEAALAREYGLRCVAARPISDSYTHDVFDVACAAPGCGCGVRAIAKAMRADDDSSAACAAGQDVRARLRNQAAAIAACGAALAPQIICAQPSTAADSDGGIFVAFACAGRPYLLTLFERAAGGTLFAALGRARAPPPELLAAFGHTMGRLSRQLLRFRAPTAARVPPHHLGAATALAVAAAGAPREAAVDTAHFRPDAAPWLNDWDLRYADVHTSKLPLIQDAEVRAACSRALAAWTREVVPLYSAAADGAAALRFAWVHNDVNDYNVVLSAPFTGAPAAAAVDGSGADDDFGSGGGAISAALPHARVIDFDDLTFSALVHEAAVALAYILMDRADPVAEGARFLRHYCELCPLTAAEAACLLPLLRVRLVVSLCQSAAAAARADAVRARYILTHAEPAARLLRLFDDDAAAQQRPCVAGALGGDFASVHTAGCGAGGLAEVRARWLVACGHLEPPREPRTYVRAPCVSAEQAAASAAVLAALDQLGAAGRLHVVSDAILQAASGDAAATAAAAAGDASARGWWRVPPAVFDNTGGVDMNGTSVTAMLPPDLSSGDLAEQLARSASAAFAPLALPPAADGTPRWRIGWGRYGENRVIYTSPHFAAEAAAPAAAAGGGGESASASEARTVHLGVDLQLPVGAALRAPLAGVVHSWARNWHELDYGPTIVLRHDLRCSRRDGAAPLLLTFYSLWGHLTLSSILTRGGAWRLRVGERVPAGALVGWVGASTVNGGWPAHLHLQLDSERGHGGWRGDYPGVCARADWRVYQALCPDPNVLLRCPTIAPVGAWGAAAAAASSAAFTHVEVLDEPPPE